MTNTDLHLLVTPEDDERRLGAYAINYGWLYPTWAAPAATQGVWKAH